MAFSRYSRDIRISLGTQLGTANSVLLLKNAIRDGLVPIVNQIIATGDDRLDTLAGNYYGDSRYWWILAAASGIGWGLQVPAGTVINIIKLDDALAIVR